MFKFETLKVWHKAVEFADTILEITDSFPQKYQYSFGEQLRRAALSIPSNIAEGNGRKGRKESANFFNISKGSTYECVNILIILDKRNLIDWKKFHKNYIYNLAEEICKMLSGLMR